MNTTDFTPTVAVIGGGLRGLAAAEAAAENGAKVFLIEPRQYLGREMTAAGHNWIESEGFETGLANGSMRKLMLARQLAAGATPLLASHAGGLAVSNGKTDGGDDGKSDGKSDGEAAGKTAGVVVCNSWGVHLLRADAVIDTEGTLFAEPFDGKKTMSINYSFTLSGADAPFFTETTVDPALGLAGNRVFLHRDPRPGCYSVEFSFDAQVDFVTFRSPQRLLPEAQRRAEKLWRWFRENVPVFASSVPHRLMFHEVRLTGYVPTQRALPGGAFVFADPLPASFTAEDIARMKKNLGGAVRRVLSELSPAGEPDALDLCGRTLPLAECGISSDEAPFAAKLTLPNGFLPEIGRYPVLVAGAGTTGVQVMRALTEKNVPFAVAEPNALAGGTMNLGLVTSYWHGYTGGLNARLDEESKAYASAYSEKPNAHDNLAALMLMNRLFEGAEANSFPLTFVCGAEVGDGNVKRTILCGEGGLFALSADVVVDATGDGAAAYLAGADYEVGDPRDGSVQSCSEWGETIRAVGTFLNDPNKGDVDIADPESYADNVRVMLVGTREESDFDNTPMLTVRESRRIVGDYQLTMEDIWNETPFDDTLAVTLTPFDTHGKGSTLFSDCGMNSNGGRELRAHVPYRSYLVKGFKNLLITAKAFSATRDAASVCRMNPDLRHAGYAVGLCAAQAVERGCTLREVDVKPVQTELLEKGCLPEWTFDAPAAPNDAELLASALTGDRDSLRTLCLGSDDTARMVFETYRTGKLPAGAEPSVPTDGQSGSSRAPEVPDSDPALDAQGKPGEEALTFLAAWFGDERALDSLAGTIAKRLDAPCSNRDGDYGRVCRSLAALVKAEKVDPALLAPIIERAGTGGPATYAHNPKYVGRIYGFNRVDCWKFPAHLLLHLIAEAVERHADASLAGPMEKLLEKEYVSGYLTVNGKSDGSPLVCHGLAPAFCTVLELRLTAAAARCGSRKALAHLADFTGEDRSLVRKFASRELAALTGREADGADGWREIVSGIAEPKVLPFDGEIVLR